MKQSELFLITALQHVEVAQDLGRGDRIADDIYITNNASLIASKLTNQMTTMFGRLEMANVITSKLVAYRLVETDAQPDDIAADRAVLGFLRELKHLQIALWLVRDNAMSMENAFLEWPYRTEGAVLAMNTWAGSCSNSGGLSKTEVFTREELNRACKMHEVIWSKEQPPEFRAGEPTQPEVDRFSRGLYFLQAARANASLSLKVAMYCSAFEALLSTDSSELSHKLAERLAWIVAESPAARPEVFRAVKSAYAIRSRAMHGSTLSKRKSDTELAMAASNCDDLLRALLSQITNRDDLRAAYIDRRVSEDALEAMLLRITLGLPGGPVEQES